MSNDNLFPEIRVRGVESSQFTNIYINFILDYNSQLEFVQKN